MAENLIGNMFGVDPDQLAQQRYDAQRQAALQYAQLDPFARANMAMYQAGGNLVNAGAGMMGVKTTEEQKTTVRQKAFEGVDPSTSEGLLIAIKRLTDAGDTQGATALANTLRQVKLEESRIAKEAAMAEDIPKQRHEEAMARVQQAADAAKLRSEDTRLAIQQRREAAMQHAELMRYLAQVKAGDKTSTTDAGRSTVTDLTTKLRDYYSQLSEKGAITDPTKSVVDNIGAWISSSAVGQVGGSMVGSQAQTIRDSIAQQRPLLLQAIKQATGMSAKQMDSNAELKMYLSAATDPKLSVQANRDALDMLDKLYGLGGVDQPKEQDKPKVEEWIRVGGKLQRK